jgi:hypothetical protein
MNVPDPERLEQLHSEIGARLKRVCAHLPADEFNTLVRQIATVTLRYEDRPPLSRPIVNKAIDADR